MIDHVDKPPVGAHHRGHAGRTGCLTLAVRVFDNEQSAWFQRGGGTVEQRANDVETVLAADEAARAYVRENFTA